MNEAIEVEVLEIDGAAPVPSVEEPSPSSPQPAWQTWQGRLRRLDSRWWPLWVALGLLAVGLLLTVGLALGLLFLIVRTVTRFVRGLLGLLAGSTPDARLNRR